MKKHRIGDELLLRNGTTCRVIGVRHIEGSEPEFLADDDPYFWRPDSGKMGDIPSSFDVVLNTTPPKRTKAERVLLELAGVGEEYCLSFKTIANQTGLTISEVGACCRYLACEGLAQCVHGLMDYDNCQVAGSGYSITAAGKLTMS